MQLKERLYNRQMKTPAMQNRHFYQLDSLRGIFILGIVIYHVNAYFDAAFSGILGPVYKYGGYFGNYFFFMLSGFLTAYTYRSALCEGRLSFSGFMARRLRRLYPLYILTTVVQLCLRILLHETAGITTKAIFLNILMIPSGWIYDGMPFNTPLWFVSVLMLCYIIFFALCRLSGKDDRRYRALVILLMLWRLVLEIGNLDIPFCYNYDGEGFLNFFTGCLLFEMYSRLDKSYIRKLSIWGIAVVCLLGVFSIFGLFRHIPVDIRFVITFLICPALILAALTVPAFSQVLTLRPLVWLGSISISVFFWHAPLLKAFTLLSPWLALFIHSPQAVFLAYLMFVILFCAVSQQIIQVNK